MKLGVAVFSFNRPHYLKECLASLEGLFDKKGVEFFFFQEGVQNKFSGQTRVKRSVVEENLALWDQADLPAKRVYAMPEHLGVALLQQHGRREVFKTCDTILHVEDDLVLEPHYLELIRQLFRQFGKAPWVGGMAGSYGVNTTCPLFGQVLQTKPFPNLGWAISARQWARVEPYYQDYLALVQCDYRLRPHKAIREWYRSKGCARPQSSQDCAIDLCHHLAGLLQISTVLPRLRHIGVHGEHMTPELHEKLHFSTRKPYSPWHPVPFHLPPVEVLTLFNSLYQKGEV